MEQGNLETLENPELIQRISDLEKEIKALKEINKNSKIWLALLSHDFKGVFSGLGWILNMYNNKSISTDILIEMLIELEKNVRTCLRALDDTFLAARIQYDNFLSEKETINLQELYSELIGYFSDSIAKKELILEFAGKQEINIQCNKLILKSILIKIIDNSIKFSLKGNKIVFTVGTANDYQTHITIEDFGMGMDDYTLCKIFSLNRAPSLGTENEKGAGLGLVLAKEALRLINGTISINSIKGQGTKVLITL